MQIFLNPNRRRFLKTVATALASIILPKSFFAGKPDTSFWFIHAGTNESWPVADPAKWSLENARQPILERAREGLLRLTLEDGERIIRLVTRRCKLNLLELHSNQVVVHYWCQGRAYLKPFFKTHRLARREIEVVLRERKREVITTKTGDDFLFGSRLATDFPLNLYLGKWQRRFEQEPDDWTATPETLSGYAYAWDGIENNRIPWAALKSAWRRSSPMVCLNCDQPTILIWFGKHWHGMFKRSPRFNNVCRKCRRSLWDESERDVDEWMEQNLDAEVRPTYEMVWDRRVKCEPWIGNTIPS